MDALMDSVQERCMKAGLKYIVAAAAALVLGGCAFMGSGSTGKVSTADQAAFQKVFMSSYFAERGGLPGGAKGLTPFIKGAGSSTQPSGSKATVPVGQLADTHFATLSPKTFINYPEPGQTTTFTLTTWDAANHVYDVTATTTFPSDDMRKTYVEEYFVMDGNPTYSLGADGIWTTDDAIVRLSGGLWVQDQKARVQQVLTFQDGTTRTETIVAYSTGAGQPPLFDKTGLDVNGSLDFSQLFYPAQVPSPLSTTIQFSSVVMYYVTPSTNTNFWFWKGTQAQTILGIRYYTEDLSGGQLNTYTVAFEKTVDALTTTGGSFSTTLASVFAGSKFSSLAESVLRQQVTYTVTNGVPDFSTGTKITNMKTRVADVTSQKDFYLQQLSNDSVTLSGYDTTTIYTPTAAVNDIITANPSQFVYSRTLASSGNSLPLYYIPGTTTDTTGTGDLATLYTSIQEGNAALHTGSTIPGKPPPAGIEWAFNGAQGTTIPSSSVTTVGQTGPLKPGCTSISRWTRAGSCTRES